MISRKISVDELFLQRNDRIPVITQEKDGGRILGLHVTDRNAFMETVRTGKCHYYDEVNDAVYLKGEHSREIESIVEIRLDCCHARRHQFHLLYRVIMAEGKCKFGVSDCHFYLFSDGRFEFDTEMIIDPKAVEEHSERIEKLLSVDEDLEHQRRFG